MQQTSDLNLGSGNVARTRFRRRQDAKTLSPNPPVSRRHDRDWYRKLFGFAREAGFDEREALSFLFENFNSVINHDNLTHRLRIFNSELEARKRKSRRLFAEAARLEPETRHRRAIQ